MRAAWLRPGAATLPEFRITRQAADDLLEIFVYGEEIFGPARAERYQNAMIEVFTRLAENPMMGRAAERIGTALRRHPHASHVVFYTPTANGIIVERVVHMAYLKGLDVFD
jgi:toxin ParE1/3/4